MQPFLFVPSKRGIAMFAYFAVLCVLFSAHCLVFFYLETTIMSYLKFRKLNEVISHES